MSWSNIRLIFLREVRDQLRDRRTLFMVAVLPVLLYPLLGLSFFQVAQFMGEKPSRILVIGAREPLDPPLFQNNRFPEVFFTGPAEMRLLELTFFREEEHAGDSVDILDEWKSIAEEAVRSQRYDAVLLLPPGFAGELARFREEIRRQLTAQLERGNPSANGTTPLISSENGDARMPDTAGARSGQTVVITNSAIPSPQVFYSTARERSQTAYNRLRRVLDAWSQQVMVANLAAAQLPPEAARPFQIETADVALGTAFYGAAVWAKILPVLLVIWSLTGAFYPAVDLCAGEKERGTLETLLSSPAKRGEIVLGKLGAITVFSMATAVLNLISMGLTGWLAFGHLPQFSAPPIWAVLWLALALPPTSAAFSCLALGIAAFARSSKEGQYYLMPLLFVVLPLVGLPMARGSELDLGTALIPVTGLVLLVKTLIEGQLDAAIRFVLPVTAVTFGGCVLALRWSVRQFNSEQVLFRESERFELSLWLRHTIRRRPVPTPALAVACGLAILLVRLLLTQLLSRYPIKLDLIQQAILSQVLVVLLPTLCMTFLFIRDMKGTLGLRWSGVNNLVAAAALAVVLHPTFAVLKHWVMKLYPLDPALADYLKQLASATADWPTLLIALALVPAVCEELAFRGYMLTGFRQTQRAFETTVYTALFFALSHTLVQQSLLAFMAGLVLGGLAIRTGSVLPCIVYHAIHNALSLADGAITAQVYRQLGWLQTLATWGDDGLSYRSSVVVAGILAAGLILTWLKSPSKMRSDSAVARVGA